MGNHVRDLKGKTFGNILVMHQSGRTKVKGAEWLCKCLLCGGTFTRAGANIVRSNGSKGCGCGGDGKVLAISGKKFGRLTVEYRVENSKRGRSRWLCLCDCGEKVVVTGKRLTSGHTISCGCAKIGVNKTHGMTGTREYSIWCGMKKRCNNKNFHAYDHYGGRGISVCDKWMNDFAAFMHDMGPCPEGLTIDRVDNDGGYEPGNCKWATCKEQASNRHAKGYLEGVL